MAGIRADILGLGIPALRSPTRSLSRLLFLYLYHIIATRRPRWVW